MPKMKDLGINVLPETMRPPEIGDGGGGGGCGAATPAAPCAAPSIVCICTAASPGTINCGCTFHPPTYCICTFLSPCTTNSACLCTFFSCGHGSCACSIIASICTAGSHPITTTIITTTPQYAEANLISREDVAILRDQLKEQLSSLDAIEKTIGPTAAAALDAREAELKKELEDLAKRRKNLKK